VLQASAHKLPGPPPMPELVDDVELVDVELVDVEVLAPVPDDDAVLPPPPAELPSMTALPPQPPAALKPETNAITPHTATDDHRRDIRMRRTLVSRVLNSLPNSLAPTR